MAYKSQKFLVYSQLCTKILAVAILSLFLGCSSNDQSSDESTTSSDKSTALPEASQSEASRAREALAQNTVGAINRAQQAYRLENPTFATSFQELGIGDGPGIDEIYDVKIVSADAKQAYVTATAKQPDSRSFSGVATEEGGLTTIKVCSTESASQTPPPIDCEGD